MQTIPAISTVPDFHILFAAADEAEDAAEEGELEDVDAEQHVSHGDSDHVSHGDNLPSDQQSA